MAREGALALPIRTRGASRAGNLVDEPACVARMAPIPSVRSCWRALMAETEGFEPYPSTPESCGSHRFFLIRSANWVTYDLIGSIWISFIRGQNVGSSFRWAPLHSRRSIMSTPIYERPPRVCGIRTRPRSQRTRGRQSSNTRRNDGRVRDSSNLSVQECGIASQS